MIFPFSPDFRRFSATRAGFAAGILALAAGLAGCQKADTQSVVLAQVGDSKLTLEELRETYPAEYEKVLPREQYLDVIQRWIDDEAVYQQALKRKLDEEPQVRRKLERLRRRMIVEEFLAREAGGIDAEPDEGAMTRHYENNKSDFLRKSPEYRYLHIRLGTLKDALAVRARVRGNNFAELAAEHSLDSTARELPEPPFRKTSEVPPCLHDVLDAKPGWVSSPVSCPDGVYLVKLLDRIEAGTSLPFQEVRATIAARLAMQHKERMRQSKIRQYKEGVAISLNVDEIPGQDGADARAPEPAVDDTDERLPPGE